ncbi:MAG: hypothetical protein JEZ08_01340 [Clostridiales bacterium]|nr:hypothetical protein [Clostridiales bacterium]
MRKEMKDLTKILLGGENLSLYISDDMHIVDAVANKFNNLLDIKPNTIDELKTSHTSKTPIAPIAFSALSHKPKFDFVYMSLTPEYDKSRVHSEKQVAGEKWNDYINFYTSNKYFDFTNEWNSSHYTNVIKLLFALYEDHETGKISIEDIEKQLNTEKKYIFNTLLKDKSILFPSIVPFHSQGFNTNMNGINHLRDNMPGYDKYLDALLDYIKTSTEDNAIIISNNYADSRVVYSLLESDGAELLLDNQLLSVQKWDSKFAVLFNDHLFSRHGLRSDFEIDTVMTHITTLLKNGSENKGIKELEDYCKSLLEKREEEDHKSRGQRIKGNKLKKVAVKKLRKEKVFTPPVVTPAPVVAPAAPVTPAPVVAQVVENTDDKTND